MASPSPEQVIESQRQDWNRVAGGWGKWDRFFDEQMAFLNHRLVADARLRSGMRVLDLGSGTGYPGLLAAQIVGPSGSLVGVDLAEQMLVIADRKAKRLGLTNVTFHTGNATTLSFGTEAFDAVISRFCLMFLPEIPKALTGIVRMLKAGGWLSAAVWSSPDKNPYLRLPMDAIKQLIELPPPDVDAPGIFRLAKSGDLSEMLLNAGFTDVSEQEFIADVRFPTALEYVASLLDIAAPIQNLFAKLSADQQRQANQLITQQAENFQRSRSISLPIAVRMVAGRKPG
jgi:SAM-dependent methyltransferase